MAPALTAEQARSAMRGLESTIIGRSADIEVFQNYYDGEQSLRFASEEYRDWFAEQYDGFADNWCAPVVDATVERLKIEGVRPRGATKVDSDLHRAWEENGAQAGSKLAFTTSAIARRSFALVWGDRDGRPIVTFEHPSECAVEYVAGSRSVRSAALKMWRDGDTEYAVYYRSDFVYKFTRTAVVANKPEGTDAHRAAMVAHYPGAFGPVVEWQAWKPEGDDTWPLRNPMQEVPVVELQNRPRLKGEPLNEISGVAAMQDAINSLWSYLFTAADFAALPQRVILGAQLPKIPVLDSDGNKVGEKPIDLPEANIKRILNLEGPDAKIAQWDPARLDIFTGVLGKAVAHLANQTRTPLHYFASSIENISGDTLQALETGLNAKISDRKIFMDDPILEVYRLIALALDQRSKADAVRGGTVLWSDHEVRSDAQKMDKLSKMKELGFPVEYIIEQYTGGDSDETERIMNMRKSEAENDPLSHLAASMNAQDDDPEAEGPPRRTGGSDNGEDSGTRQLRRDRG